MISTIRPKDFLPIYNVASCFLERDGKILLVLRLPDKSEGDKWGVPAGKIERHELPLQAIRREVAEETAINLGEADFKHFQTYFVRFPDYDFIYHVFHAQVPGSHEAQTNPAEHQGFCWVSPVEAMGLNLVKHQDDCIRFFYGKLLER